MNCEFLNEDYFRSSGKIVPRFRHPVNHNILHPCVCPDNFRSQN